MSRWSWGEGQEGRSRLREEGREGREVSELEVRVRPGDDVGSRREWKACVEDGAEVWNDPEYDEAGSEERGGRTRRRMKEGKEKGEMRSGEAR